MDRTTVISYGEQGSAYVSRGLKARVAFANGNLPAKHETNENAMKQHRQSHGVTCQLLPIAIRLTVVSDELNYVRFHRNCSANFGSPIIHSDAATNNCATTVQTIICHALGSGTGVQRMA